MVVQVTKHLDVVFFICPPVANYNETLFYTKKYYMAINYACTYLFITMFTKMLAYRFLFVS